jgi:predicted Zn-dependent protease
MIKTLLICTLTLYLSGCSSLAHKVNSQPQQQPTQKESAAPSKQSNSKRFLYLAADTAAHNGQQALAIQLFTSLVKQLNTSKNKDDLASISPRLKLATLLLQNKQAKQALEYIKPLIDRHPIATTNSVEEKNLYTFYARILANLNQQNNALDVLTQLLAQHPDFSLARKLQIALFIQTKQFNLATMAIDTTIKRKDSAFLRQLQADIYAREGKFKKAKKSLEHMQSLNPEDETPALLQSQLYLQQHKIAEAEQVLRAFISSHKDNLRTRHTLARLLIQNNRPKEAIQIYKSMALDLPESAEILSALGSLYYQQQQFELARKQFEQALKLEPNNPSYRFYLAGTLEAQHKPEQARPLYKQISNEHPLWQEAQLRLASMDLVNEDYSSAHQHIQHILKRFPSDGRAWLLLSAQYLGQKKFQRLLDETQSAIALKNIPPRLLLNRAIAFEHFKRYDEVEDTLKTLLNQSPQDSDALNFLGYTYADQGIKLDEAEAYIKRALEIQPDDGYFLDSLAWVYFKRAKYDKAIKIQRKALNIVAKDAVMQEHLGDMLWMNGEKDAALKQWKKALSLNPNNAKALRLKIKHGL